MFLSCLSTQTHPPTAVENWTSIQFFVHLLILTKEKGVNCLLFQAAVSLNWGQQAIIHIVCLFKLQKEFSHSIQLQGGQGRENVY